MGKCGRCLRALQSVEGRPNARPFAHVSQKFSSPAERRRTAEKRPEVSAQLPAPVLGRLSLLGQRTRALECPSASGFFPAAASRREAAHHHAR